MCSPWVTLHRSVRAPQAPGHPACSWSWTCPDKTLVIFEGICKMSVKRILGIEMKTMPLKYDLHCSHPCAAVWGSKLRKKWIPFQHINAYGQWGVIWSTWEHPKLNKLDASRAGIANSEQDLVFVVKLHTDNFKSLVDASTVAGICSRLGL